MKILENVGIKRIGAYLIDILIIAIVSALLARISFINPKYDEYVNTSKEYTEILNAYYDEEIDINEFNEYTEDISYQITKTGYVYIIIDIFIDLFLFLWIISVVLLKTSTLFFLKIQFLLNKLICRKYIY